MIADKTLRVFFLHSYFANYYSYNDPRNGWRIVAVEQAEESVPLQDFVFPSKTLLLLGKEREGVPVELLNQVSIFLSPYIHITISG